MNFSNNHNVHSRLQHSLVKFVNIENRYSLSHVSREMNIFGLIGHIWHPKTTIESLCLCLGVCLSLHNMKRKSIHPFLFIWYNVYMHLHTNLFINHVLYYYRTCQEDENPITWVFTVRVETFKVVSIQMPLLSRKTW